MEQMYTSDVRSLIQTPYSHIAVLLAETGMYGLLLVIYVQLREKWIENKNKHSRFNHLNGQNIQIIQIIGFK